MGFKGKIVIVTGASSGIGAAIAVKFAEEEAKLVLAARNEKRLKDVANKCQEYTEKPLMIIADVSSDNDVKKIINTTINQYGKIDILVNNAGIVDTGTIYEDNAMQVFDRIMATNLRSAVYLTHLASRYLIETKGNIVNISSIAGLHTIEGHFAYCTSKAGMDHFTRSTALDLGPKGVRVNSVNPGPVETSIMENKGITRADQSEFWKKFAKYTTLGRVSMPEETADLVLFLASDKARGITGSSFVTDNGVLLQKNLDMNL